MRLEMKKDAESRFCSPHLDFYGVVSDFSRFCKQILHLFVIFLAFASGFFTYW